MAKIKKIIDAVEGIKKSSFLGNNDHYDEKKFDFIDDIQLLNTMQ